jgi:predicted  nucleic acid-binding Zn-ribbon protein
MAVAKSTSELKALQERVAHLEKQLRELQSRVDAGQRPIKDRPWTKEDARAYHEAAQRVQKVIDRNREADRRRAAAEYDRLHGRSKRVSSAPPKSAKESNKVRRAG